MGVACVLGAVAAAAFAALCWVTRNQPPPMRF